MKCLLVLVVLLAVFTHGAVIPTTRSNLSVGYVTAYDRLLYRQYLQKYPVQNAVQYQDFIFRGNYSTRISAVTATEVGYTQYASAWVLSGGVGYNHVTVRVQSARGYGYYYVIDVWGR